MTAATAETNGARGVGSVRMMLNNGPAVGVELATWNAVDVESSLAIVKTDESRECHVPAHCEA